MSGRWGGVCPDCQQLYSAGGHAHVCPAAPQPQGCKSPYCEPPWCKNCGDKPRPMKLGDLYSGVCYTRVQRCGSCPWDTGDQWERDCEAPYCMGMPENVPAEWFAEL